MFSFGRMIRYGLAAALIAIVAAAGLSHEAAAFSCTDGAGGYSYAACDSSANKSGTTVTSAALVTTAAATTIGLVTSRVSQFRQNGGGSSVRGALPSQSLFAAGNGTGASAGENMDTRFGVWGNIAYLRSEGDKTGANFESDLTSGMVGADYRLGSIDVPTFVGISFGYETADITTSFNRGGIDTEGLTFAPYVSFGLTKVFSIDAVAGYTMMQYDTNRKDPLSNATVTGSFDADRYFGAVDLVGGWTANKWNLGARLGTSYVNEEQDAYRESNGNAVGIDHVETASANTGVRVGYSFDRIEPYVGATYSYDFANSGGLYDERNTVGGSLGLNVAVMPSVSVNVEGRASAKEDIQNYGGSATLRLAF
jgi:outer membrane autotransporter protein